MIQPLNTSYVAERRGGGTQDLLRWFESTRNCYLHRFNIIEPQGGVSTSPFQKILAAIATGIERCVFFIWQAIVDERRCFHTAFFFIELTRADTSF